MYDAESCCVYIIPKRNWGKNRGKRIRHNIRLFRERGGKLNKKGVSKIEWPMRDVPSTKCYAHKISHRSFIKNVNV